MDELTRERPSGRVPGSWSAGRMETEQRSMFYRGILRRTQKAANASRMQPHSHKRSQRKSPGQGRPKTIKRQDGALGTYQNGAGHSRKVKRSLRVLPCPINKILFIETNQEGALEYLSNPAFAMPAILRAWHIALPGRAAALPLATQQPVI